MYSYPSGNNAGAVAGGLASSFACLGLIAIVFIALQVWLFWRILEKAGLSPWLALISIIGGLGTLVLLFILALSEWPSLRPPIAYIPPPTSYGAPPAQSYTTPQTYTPPSQPMVQPSSPPAGESPESPQQPPA